MYENGLDFSIGGSVDRKRQRRVVFYGRVSTEHEAQLAALENQMKWYDDQANYHDNWTVLKKYIDEGITGTQAKKRPAFLQMIQDAKQKKFDLIVTREVCRFARNTVDTLVVTRELKNYGVEVYFVEDNIWTMDGDGELRLTIMATLAQEESRKTSERVRAGQKISRDKGVLYGNGNILGYDRDKNTGTYVINSDQAETVRMIYDLYSSGKGMGQIRNEMIRRGRKDSSGLVRWDYSKISRVLHNSVYKGYMAYLKSRRNNFLDQKTIRNHDESTYMYVKGNFEPIISEEQWERCKQIREQRRRQSHYFTSDGEVKHTIGIREGNDVWVKKLVCRCGHKMRRNKWRKNKNGDIIYGYKCYNQLNNGSKSVREEAGVVPGNTCDLREICDWKLEMMARHIFSGLWGNKKNILNEVSSLYQIGYYEENKHNEEIKAKLDQDIAKIEEKLKRLTRMRLDDEISKADYLEYKSEIEKDKERVIKQRAVVESGVKSVDGYESADEKIQNFLLQKMNFTEHIIDRDVISQFISTVIPRTETCYEWYMDFDLIEKSNDKKKMGWEFTIEYNEARAYRSENDGLLRPTQWSDIIVKVYV